MTDFKTVLVDSDIIACKAAFAVQTVWYFVGGERFKFKKEAEKHAAETGQEVHKQLDVLPFPVAVAIVDRLLEGIARNLNCSNLNLIIGPPSGTKIFRHDVYSQYKENRSGTERPVHLEAIRQYLIDAHAATVANDMETDDLMGIVQCSEAGTVIASIDKDLLQIPGHHYNIDQKEVTLSADPGSIHLTRAKGKNLVLKGNGFTWFAAQMLLGDKVDNIPKPKKGLGPKKVFGMLEGKEEPQELWKVIEEVYKDSEVDLETNATLLWILREHGKDWKVCLDM